MIKRTQKSKISQCSLTIHGIHIHELKSKARKMKKDYGVQIIFIDYISLISVAQNNTPRFEQVAFLSKNLRELARELEIPIIVLSQVTRNAEGREPSLANLRESGALEKDADTVIFLHREKNEEPQDRYTPLAFIRDLCYLKRKFFEKEKYRSL
ncbi:DnaB-like helicase C-terminal domain-containing protein [Borreliella garinii]|uniref:DnaB-like helicase C-terminal domain-containing protein n=1 Tax=Borreliella garinii TaxID=29519 RepID=UPI002E18A852